MEDKKTPNLPIPPTRGPLKDSNTPVKINDVTSPTSKEKSQKTLDPLDSEIRDIKRKETAAAVACMKDKLRSMGMLGRTGETNRKLDLSGRKKTRIGSVSKDMSSEISYELNYEEKCNEEVEKEEEEDDDEEDEETDDDNNDKEDDNDNDDDDDEQGHVDMKNLNGLQRSTNKSVQPIGGGGGGASIYDPNTEIPDKKYLFSPPPPPTEFERKRENMIEIEELSFDNKEDSLNYEEEYSEDYGSIQGTIQFNNNSAFSGPIISDASDTVMKNLVKEVEKGGVENMFFESELETAPESIIRKNGEKNQEIFSMDLGLSSSYTISGKKENTREDTNSGNEAEEDSENENENENINENENEKENAKREEYLYNLYLDQEKLLSVKSAQCRDIIRCAL